MAKRQSENPVTKEAVKDCLDEAALIGGFISYEDYIDSYPTMEERTAFWEEYAWLMGREHEIQEIMNGEIIIITIPEGLWQSNNLNHLFTVM